VFKVDADRVPLAKKGPLWEKAHELRLQLTPAEDALWQRLRGHQLLGLHFQRQYVIGPFIVDFYCRPAKLVVEVDGDVHRGQEARDAERDAYLASQGLHVLRFRNEETLGNLEGVVRSIGVATAEHPTPIPSPNLGEGDRKRK
jgi:very-short-patch-repair endonuclease